MRWVWASLLALLVTGWFVQPSYSQLNLPGLPPAETVNPGDLVAVWQNELKKTSVKTLLGPSIGMVPQEPVRVATTTALSNGPVYDNGIDGVGATLKPVGTGNLIIDGKPVSLNDRVLVKDQPNPIQNGVYIVTKAGDPATPYVLTRATDWDTVSEMFLASYFYILDGTVNGYSGWYSAANPSIAVGTSPITFSRLFGIPPPYTAGTYLTVNNNVFDLKTPVPVVAGGTNCITAGGACLDNIAGFNFTGPMQRTGPGAYSAVPPVVPGHIIGTTTGDEAGPGEVGQYVFAQRLSTNAIPLPNGGIDVGITSIPLDIGDWDVWASAGYTLTNNNSTFIKAWINILGATNAPSVDQVGGNAMMPVNNNAGQVIMPVTPIRILLTAPGFMQLGSTVTASGGTTTGWGKIMARRRR